MVCQKLLLTYNFFKIKENYTMVIIYEQIHIPAKEIQQSIIYNGDQNAEIKNNHLFDYFKKSAKYKVQSMILLLILNILQLYRVLAFPYLNIFYLINLQYYLKNKQSIVNTNFSR